MAAAKGKIQTMQHSKNDKKELSRRPIVDVFDDEPTEKVSSVQPARTPVVVEIESVLDQKEESQVTESLSPPAAPKRERHHTLDVEPAETLEESNIVIPEDVPAPSSLEEPSLPSFFEHDLKGEPQEPENPARTTQPQEMKELEKTIPQAFVGEIDEITDDVKSEKKKLIGILCIVVAVLLLSIGLLVVYAKNVQQSTMEPSPTPEGLVATPRPTITPSSSPTPIATKSGTLTATASGALADLKKKVKIDVLNGTTISGLAAKEAANLKKAGFVTGTVGNGKPENAGTIAVSSANVALATEIQKLLATYTFTITKNEKLVSVQVTLGEPK